MVGGTLQADKDLDVFDPLQTERHAPFVWDDGVHRVVGSEISHGAICFHTACHNTFALPLLGLPVQEYRIGNPAISCRECMETP